MTGFSDFSDQIVSFNDIDHGLQQDHLGRIAQPGVEDAERLVRSERVFVEEASELELLAESYDIRAVLELKVLVRPHFASGTASGLHLKII